MPRLTLPTRLPHPSQKRTRRALMPACEGLEGRALLSVGSVVLRRFSIIEHPGQAVSVDLPLDASRVQAPASGRTLFDIDVQPDTTSSLKVGQVVISRQGGGSVVRKPDRNGDTLVALAPGDYTLTVHGRGASTGGFAAAVQLVGDANGDGAVAPADLALFGKPVPGTGQVRALHLEHRNLGAVTLNPSVSFRVINGTSPKSNPRAMPAFLNSQIFVAITAQNAAGQFVHLDQRGNPIAMQLSDNTAANHLTKNGVAYSNYFFPLKDVETGWDVPYGLSGARLWVGLGSPLYFRVNTDVNGHIGFTTPDLNNPTDPNIDIYWDHTEFATVNSGINANTTQVDEFGFPQTIVLKASGLPDQVVGINASRQAIFDSFKQTVPAAFQPLLTAQAPYRIIAPKHGVFSQSKNPTFFDAYINQVWNHFQTTPWTFTNVLGTFTGKADPATNVLNLTQQGVKNGPVYRVNKPQTWEVFAAAGNMKTGNAVELAIEAQIVAGITRHVALDNPALNVAPFQQSVINTFYKAAPANAYAAFWHQKGIRNLAYGFDYDDVYHQNPSVVAPQSASPQVAVGIGWN